MILRKKNNGFLAIAVIVIFGISSCNLLAAKKSKNIYTKVSKIIKLSIEGALVCYASYIAFELLMNSITDVQRLVDMKKLHVPSIKRLAHNGSIIMGLGFLVFHNSDAFLNDMATL